MIGFSKLILSVVSEHIKVSFRLAKLNLLLWNSQAKSLISTRSTECDANEVESSRTSQSIQSALTSAKTNLTSYLRSTSPLRMAVMGAGPQQYTPAGGKGIHTITQSWNKSWIPVTNCYTNDAVLSVLIIIIHQWSQVSNLLFVCWQDFSRPISYISAKLNGKLGHNQSRIDLCFALFVQSSPI